MSDEGRAQGDGETGVGPLLEPVGSREEEHEDPRQLEPRQLDAGTAQTLREMVAKGAMPPLVFVVADCRAAYDRMRARGVEFTQEPVDRYGSVDAGFRDPSGNGWKMIEARRP